MKAFSKLDTGVSPDDQRRITRQLSEMMDEVDTVLAKENAIDYAPPAIRAAHELGKEIRSTWTEPGALTVPALSRVEQLCLLCRELTFGEMVEFAEGIKADPAVIHAWATKYP